MRQNKFEIWYTMYPALRILPSDSLGRIMRYVMGYYFEEEEMTDEWLEASWEKALCDLLIQVIESNEEYNQILGS